MKFNKLLLMLYIVKLKKCVSPWESQETALKGYKDGSYGGAMKGVMKGQVVSMSDEDIASVAAYISTLK